MTVLVQKTLTNVLSGLLGKNKMLQNSKLTHTRHKKQLFHGRSKCINTFIKMRPNRSKWESGRGAPSVDCGAFLSLFSKTVARGEEKKRAKMTKSENKITYSLLWHAGAPRHDCGQEYHCLFSPPKVTLKTRHIQTHFRPSSVSPGQQPKCLANVNRK